MASPDPDLPYPWWRRLWVRVGLFLDSDILGDWGYRKAWGRAADQPGLAQEMWRARIPCPVGDAPLVRDAWMLPLMGRIGSETPMKSQPHWKHPPGCANWVLGLAWHRGVSPVIEEGHVRAWVCSLPPTPAGQLWRNRALWSAVLAGRSATVSTLLAHGADVHAPSDGWGNGGDQVPHQGSLLSTLISKTGAGLAEAPLLSVVRVLVDQGLSLPKAIREAPACLRPFSAEGVGELRQLGVSFSEDAIGSRLMEPLLCPLPLAQHSHAGCLGTQEGRLALKALLRYGASPNARDPRGRAPLEVLLAESGCDGSRPAQSVLQSWFTLLIRAGADPAAATSDGLTLLHVAAANKGGRIPIPLLAHLIQHNPGAWTQRPGPENGPAPREIILDEIGPERPMVATLDAQALGVMVPVPAPAPDFQAPRRPRL